jgi:DNA-binding PadR family transcriptional regulator
MGRNRRLSFTAFSVLYAIANGYRYGFDIMDATGLASGTVYPVLTRLERDGLVRSTWEDDRAANAEGRPARRYYEVSGEGATALEAAVSLLKGVGGERLRVPDPVARPT